MKGNYYLDLDSVLFDVLHHKKTVSQIGNQLPIYKDIIDLNDKDFSSGNVSLTQLQVPIEERAKILKQIVALNHQDPLLAYDFHDSPFREEFADTLTRAFKMKANLLCPNATGTWTRYDVLEPTCYIISDSRHEDSGPEKVKIYLYHHSSAPVQQQQEDNEQQQQQPTNQPIANNNSIAREQLQQAQQQQQQAVDDTDDDDDQQKKLTPPTQPTIAPKPHKQQSTKNRRRRQREANDGLSY